MKRRAFCLVGLSVVAATGSSLVPSIRLMAAGKKQQLDPPTIACVDSTSTTITLTICAGLTGAPAGFSLQWMKASDFEAGGCVWSDLACEASFSGNARDSRYRLTASNPCVDLVVGDFLFDNGASTDCNSPLEPDTAYVFRAFAHGNNKNGKSDWSATVECETDGMLPPPPPPI